MKDTQKSINLALQGGGAHGAFTWGVLDRLLADGRLAIEGISGTSAGAVNAVALAHGWATAEAAGRDPAEGAREALARVWGEVTQLGAASAGAGQIARLMMGALPGALTRVSPYQSNPLDYNPLRSLLEKEIDFARLARLKSPKVFVCATEVDTGRAAIFSGKQLSANAVMASACLPMLFQSPEITGKHYWDGGYSGNPSLAPLIEACDSQDVLLVQINPLRGQGNPTTAAEIMDRMNDLTFNASLIAQMRTIALINDMVERGVARAGLKCVHLHRIDGGKALLELPASSKVTPQRATMDKLFELGQEAAERWLKRHLAAVGEKSSVNLARDYGDPLKLDFGATLPPEADDEPDGAAAPMPALDLEQIARTASAAGAAATLAALAAQGRLTTHAPPVDGAIGAGRAAPKPAAGPTESADDALDAPAR